jgi:hypothetical protein
MPGYGIPDGKVVGQAILGNSPGLCQIRLRQTLCVKFDQSIEEKSIGITICLIVMIEQWVEPLKTPHNRLGIYTTSLRFVLQNLGLRFLDDKEQAHDKAGEQDNQNLPAKFFHKQTKGRQSLRRRPEKSTEYLSRSERRITW